MALDATSEEFIQLLRDARDAAVNVIASEAAKDAAIAARDIVLASETTTIAAKNAAENSAILAAANYQNSVTLYDSLVAVQTAQTASETAAGTSEQHQWVAEANQKTADSYATEAKDVFVKIYTSVGDGTFTSVDTAEYSSLHYSQQVIADTALFAQKTGDTFSGQVKGITPIAADDLTRKDYVDLKAPLASPALTGIPTAPTAAASTNTTQLATTEFVQQEKTVGEAIARTWINFNGTGVIAIRDSYNVLSITDNGVGDYTVTFANALPHANYAVSTSSTVYNGTGFQSDAGGDKTPSLGVLGSYTTSSVRVGFDDTDSGDYTGVVFSADFAYCNVIIFA